MSENTGVAARIYCAKRDSLACTRDKTRRFVIYVFLAACAAAVLIFPQSASSGVKKGLELCVGTVIPSLFAMMFLSILAVESSLAEVIGRRLSKITVKLFGLSGEAGAAVLISLIGGYPAGAKAVRGLYEKGAVTAAQAEQMALFCFSAGPAFVVGAVGGLFGEGSGAGTVIMLSQLVVVPLMGVFARLLCGKKHTPPPCRSACAVREIPRGDFVSAVVSSAHKTAHALVNVCLFVILFSAVREILEALGVNAALSAALQSLGVGENAAQAVLPTLMEVTSGSVYAAKAGIPFASFAVGFGGIAVHAQVYSLLGNIRVSRLMFTAARLLQGLLSALVSALLLIVMPCEAVSASAGIRSLTAASGSGGGAVLLLILCVMCVLCLPDEISQKNRSRL